MDTYHTSPIAPNVVARDFAPEAANKVWVTDVTYVWTGVPIIDVTVEAGEFLLIPVGWWHWVESRHISISMSFHNFFSRGERAIWNHGGTAAG